MLTLTALILTLLTADSPATSKASPKDAAKADTHAVKLGALTATAPPAWVAQKLNNRLRSHQFKLASGEEGVADAEVAVYPESSNKVDAKFDEWKATVVPPDGKTAADTQSTKTVDLPGATAHVLDARGTWKYRERPRDPKSKEELKPDYRVVWVIVVGADTATHVRFSGPEAVVGRELKGFEAWLAGAK